MSSLQRRGGNESSISFVNAVPQPNAQVAFWGSFSGTRRLKTGMLDYSLEVCKKTVRDFNNQVVNQGQRIGPDWWPQRQTV